MTERERWVVYPLLFLALGAALRDKLFDRTTARSIVCQELTVIEEQPIGQRPARIIAQIGRLDSARGAAANGYMVVNGRLDTDLINAKQFAYRNVPFAPALQTIMASPLDLLRALQNSAASQQQPVQQQPTNPPQPAQPDDGEAQSPPAESPASDAEADQPATSNNPSETPAQAPLADPDENQ